MSTFKTTVGRFKRRALDRIRDEPNYDSLIEQGMRVGVGCHLPHPIYIDRLHPWLITIGDYVMLSPYVAIVTHDASLAHHTAQTRLGRVDIGDRVMVGIAAVILAGTTIGEDSVIGAGAVVRGEIPPGSMVVGNPAKVSPVKGAVAWHRANAKSAPTWPQDGWTVETGISEDRKRQQREALANCGSGFVPARAAPGSPYEQRAKARSESSPGEPPRGPA